MLAWKPTVVRFRSFVRTHVMGTADTVHSSAVRRVAEEQQLRGDWRQLMRVQDGVERKDGPVGP